MSNLQRLSSKQVATTLIRFLSKSWALFALFVLVYSDFNLSALMENSDFVSCHYPGLKLLMMGHLDDIYASYTDTSFAGTAYLKFAHQLLPHLPPEALAAYVYCPLIAWLQAPLSLLPPNWSLLSWQFLSLSALLGAIALLIDNPKDRSTWQWASLSFLPNFMTILIGQFGIVFGLFFYSLAYRLLMRNRDVLAGIAFAVACLKPQFIVVPGLLMLVLMYKRRWAFPLSFLASCMFLLIANISVGGLEFFKRWLWQLHVCELVFTNSTIGVPGHIMVSLPAVILLNLPLHLAQSVKPVLYALVLCLAILAVWLCIRFAQACPDIRQTIRYCLITGILLIPFVIPHFIFSDLAIFMVVLGVSREFNYVTMSKLTPFQWSLITAAVINLYGLVFAFATLSISPLLPLAAFSVLAWRLLIVKTKPRVCE